MTKNRYNGFWEETGRKEIGLAFTPENLQLLLKKGLDGVGYTHQDIAYWCEEYWLVHEEDSVQSKATLIAQDLFMQWDLFLDNTCSLQELQSLDFSKVQLPKEWFEKWLRELENSYHFKEGNGLEKGDWIQSIDTLFFESGDEREVREYRGGYIDINVRTYHSEKYPFEGEYNLECEYLSSGKGLSFHKVEDIANIKKEVDKRMEELKQSSYKVKVSIDGKYYGSVEGLPHSPPSTTDLGFSETMGPQLRSFVESQLTADLKHYGITENALRFDWSDSCIEGHVLHYLDGRCDNSSDITVFNKDDHLIAEGWMDFIDDQELKTPIVYWMFVTTYNGEAELCKKSEVNVPDYILDTLSNTLRSKYLVQQ